MSALDQPFESWDPLESTGGADPGLIIGAQKREISNILKSYTGYYDLFAEMIQNALDSVERRAAEENSYNPIVQIDIDLKNQIVRVTDNGYFMDLTQLRQFLRPNFSFKTNENSRGNKGVGATYLAYGFNYLQTSAKTNNKSYCRLIEGGRNWVEDKTGTIARPKIVQSADDSEIFGQIDRGVSIAIKLIGSNIRPRNLGWNQATTAKQWLSLLRILTPLGGIYFSDTAPKINIRVNVIDQSRNSSSDTLDSPDYLYPHKLISRSGSLSEFLAHQKKVTERGGDPGKILPKFKRLNGLWGKWSCSELLREVKTDCPINLSLSADERKLAKHAGSSIYVYLAFSTDLWDNLNDSQMMLRKGARMLHGGLQLATRNMPQGMTLTIPMTNNIGFQNLAHVIVHFDNAEPDLGRKGFQPEYVHLAEKIAVSAVTAFRTRYHLLRKPGAAKIFSDEIKIDQWIRDQERHEQDHGLVISGAGLFLPSEELPIRSEPRVEQDVVALFNQMLSSGLVRGIQLIASSQYNQYDGLYRVKMTQPFDKFIRKENNPLGIDGDFFQRDEYITTVKILEYKYNLDGLIEELQSEVKDINAIGLVVVWEMGKKWRELFDVMCLLDSDLIHHRQIHGTTHSFTYSMSGIHAFEAIILKDLIRYLQDPEKEVAHQKSIIEEGP